MKRGRALVLGGTGMVGTAVASALMRGGLKDIVIVGKDEGEVRKTCEALGGKRVRGLRGRASPPKGVVSGSVRGYWGDIFAPYEFKDLSRKELLAERERVRRVVESIYAPLTEEVLGRFFLYKLIVGTRPSVIVDTVNTSTALAYQNVYALAERCLSDDYLNPEEVFLAAPLPQLVRHVQVLSKAVSECGVGVYLKVGTTGTGGMGLNIPYTHGEERPSRTLVTKSALGGAQSLLLMLMNRTPGYPRCVEVKPGALIGWRGVGMGEIKRGSAPIELCDDTVGSSLSVGRRLADCLGGGWRKTGGTLKAAFVDTGENGLFAREEWLTITANSQMKYVTPEEIADIAVAEIEGRSTGYNVVGGLESTVLASTYRAGLSRGDVVSRIDWRQRNNNVPDAAASVAFELLGPPRVSKLLWEAFLLGRVTAGLEELAKSDADKLASDMEAYALADETNRRAILSIGLGVLMSDGKTLLSGERLLVPADAAEVVFEESLEAWAHDGWVDLRPQNTRRWIERATKILEESVHKRRFLRGAGRGGSGADRAFLNPHSLKIDDAIEPGEVVAWVLEHEDARR